MDTLPRVDRRTAIKWMCGAVAAAAIPRTGVWAAADAADGGGTLPGAGYGVDPDLLRDYKPGDLWPLTFDDRQRRIAAALCAVIIPADEKSPSAADLGVHDFIDEWISAPYPDQAADKPRILEGLAWIEREARKRFDAGFADLTIERQSAICDEICDGEKARSESDSAAAFFDRFRLLTAGGFYTTPEGMADIGYTGNKPTLTFAGPPIEALKKAGLA